MMGYFSWYGYGLGPRPHGILKKQGGDKKHSLHSYIKSDLKKKISTHIFHDCGLRQPIYITPFYKIFSILEKAEAEGGEGHQGGKLSRIGKYCRG